MSNPLVPKRDTKTENKIKNSQPRDRLRPEYFNTYCPKKKTPKTEKYKKINFTNLKLQITIFFLQTVKAS
jgi:hypothetical protein